MEIYLLIALLSLSTTLLILTWAKLNILTMRMKTMKRLNDLIDKMNSGEEFSKSEFLRSALMATMLA